MAGSISDWAAIPSAIFKAKADTKDRAGGFSQKRGISLSPPTSSDFTFYLIVTFQPIVQSEVSSTIPFQGVAALSL